MMIMNVSDIDEGVEYFIVRGYRNPGSTHRGGRADIHGHARYESMISPDGVRVDIIEHIKDED